MASSRHHADAAQVHFLGFSFEAQPVSELRVGVFLELSCFFHGPEDVGNLISGSSAFSKTSLIIRTRPVSHTPAACSFPGENARSWEALGEARPGQSSLSAGALRTGDFP